MSQTASEAGQTYSLVGFGALAVLGVMLFNLTGGSPLVVIALLPGALGLLFRYVSSPALTLLFLTWLSYFPNMIPSSEPPVQSLSRSHFRLETLMIVAAVLVYLFAQYRLNSLKSRAFPSDATDESRKPKLRVREASEFQAEELFPSGLVFLFVLLATSLVWLAVASFRVDATGVPPLEWRRDNGFDPRSQFLILAGGVAFAMLTLGFGFRYASWLRRSPTWGRQYLLDVAWLEHRRELNRQEKRRAAAVSKLAARAAPIPKVARRTKPLTFRGQLRVVGCVVALTILAAVLVLVALVLIVALEARIRR